MNKVLSLGKDVLGFLLPRFCIECGAPSGDSFVCDACYSSIKIRISCGCCDICGKVPRSNITGFWICDSCSQKRPIYDKARCATYYDGPIKKMIYELKYNKSIWIAKDLANFLEGCVRGAYDNEQIDAICPVPLFPTRRRMRTYNQASLVGEIVAKHLKIPFREDILLRIHNTSTQTNKNIDKRFENMKHAFLSPDSVKSYVYGKTILLVDDVMTTGATFNACAEALYKQGVGRIICAAIARH